jgi:hypothetical protein
MRVNKSIVMPIILVALLMLSMAAGGFGGEDKAMPPVKSETVPEKAEKTSEVTADRAIGCDINWQVVSMGGSMCRTARYQLGCTIGQTAAGLGATALYNLNSGFWQNFSVGGICDCRPGDATNDETYNILDITYLINYLYKGGGPPAPYAVCSGDPNANCVVNLLDVTYLISYLYKGGPVPFTCAHWVGTCGPPLRL